MSKQEVPQGLKLHEYLNVGERELEALLELKESSLQAAFGFTPAQAATIAELLIANPKMAIAHMVACISTVGNVKSSIGDNEALSRLEDDLGLSTSDKTTGKSGINFSAARLIGMLFLAWFKDVVPALRALNDKAGNVWTDRKFKDTEAGKINMEFVAEFPDITLPAFPGTAAQKSTIEVALTQFYGKTAGGLSKEQTDSIKKNLARSFS